MKTLFTQTNRPRDLQVRWGELERIVTGPLEERCRKLIRHIALGCTSCRQEEIISLLMEHRASMLEALYLLDFLAMDYMESEERREDLKALRSTSVPVLYHDDFGRPL